MTKTMDVHDKIPDMVPNGAVLDIRTNGTNSHTHGFHKYPGKFIPHIPRWAIQKYAPIGNLVVDPFCGSGTSLVEATLAGHHSLGIDIDPLSVLISKVKTRHVNIALLKKTATWLEKKARAKYGKAFRPECETLEHWFTPEAILTLGRIRTAIDLLPKQFSGNTDIKKVQDIWYVCFSSVLRKVSNADNESQKTYVSSTNPKISVDAVDLFCNRISFFVKQMEIYVSGVPQNIKSEVVCGDSKIISCNSEKTIPIGLIITSPPYIKAIDYIYNQMAELFWIGDLFNMQTQQKQNFLKPFYVGNKTVYIKDYGEFDYSACANISPKLKKILHEICISDSKNGKRHAFITNTYFNNMSTHLKAAARILPKNRYYVMVLGNCFVSGVSVDVAGIISDIAEQQGFLVERKWGYKIKHRYMRFSRGGRGGIITHDWVLEMRRK